MSLKPISRILQFTCPQHSLLITPSALGQLVANLFIFALHHVIVWLV